jgi:hypothetical protein
MKDLLLAGIAALLMATSAAHARPEFLKTQAWKLILGTWCVGDQPSDKKHMLEFEGINVVRMNRH